MSDDWSIALPEPRMTTPREAMDARLEALLDKLCLHLPMDCYRAARPIVREWWATLPDDKHERMEWTVEDNAKQRMKVADLQDEVARLRVELEAYKHARRALLDI